MNYEDTMNRSSAVSDDDNWKPFRIEKCINCGKIPSITKNEFTDGPGKYVIRCCNRVAKAPTETEVIVGWNKYNTVDTSIDPGDGIKFADYGNHFSGDFGDGIIT